MTQGKLYKRHPRRDSNGLWIHQWWIQRSSV